MDQSRFIRGLLDDPADPQQPQYVPANDFGPRAYGLLNTLFPDPNVMVGDAIRQYRGGDAVGAFETMFGAIPATGALKPYKSLGPLSKSDIDTATFAKSNPASYGASSVSDANMRKYGVKDVEEVANKLAKMLQERGANVKLNRAESFPYNDIQSTPKVSYYISNLNDPDYLIKDLGQIRISDHDGGWGSRRLAKQASIDLSKNGGILEEDLNKQFDDIIRQHYHFYDPERVAAEIKQKTEEAQNAANVKREAAQNIYDDVMRQNQGNRRAHDRAIREARKVYGTFSPPTKPNSGS